MAAQDARDCGLGLTSLATMEALERAATLGVRAGSAEGA